MIRARFLVAAMALTTAVSGVAGCSDDSTAPPQPGQATVSLVTPRTDDGAILVTITGPGIGSVSPATSSYHLFWRLRGNSQLRVVVVGDLHAGPVFRLGVNDLRRLSQVTTVVEEVANRADVLQTDLAGYGLTVAGGSSQ